MDRDDSIEECTTASESNDETNTTVIVVDDDDDDAAATPLLDGVLVVGIDPGAVNCGVCLYNATLGRAVRLLRAQFRDSVTLNASGQRRAADSDPGCARVIEAVRRFVCDNPELFALERTSFVFIEDQPTLGEDPSVGSNSHKNREVMAVQFAFQTVLGPLRCIPVAPRAVKAYFGDVFPRVPNAAPGSAEQYRADKQNAIVRGREMVPADVRLRYEQQNPTKKDDGYDAFWIAAYGCQRYVKLESGTLRPKSSRPPKRPAADTGGGATGKRKRAAKTGVGSGGGAGSAGRQKRSKASGGAATEPARRVVRGAKRSATVSRRGGRVCSRPSLTVHVDAVGNA